MCFFEERKLEVKYQKLIQTSHCYKAELDVLKDEHSQLLAGSERKLPGDDLQTSFDRIQALFSSSKEIFERHRHRYEFNNDYLEEITKAGMIISGVNPKTNLVETVEIPDHPYFVGVQYHPEYKRTVLNPHPLFVAFVKACLAVK